MRIKGKKQITKDHSGFVNLIVDSEEDLWALYNIIGVGDAIKTKMNRKIQHETGSKKSSKKICIILTLIIEEIDYSQQDSIIRIKGKNLKENEYVAIGQYQTVDISIDSFFTLYKKFWDEMHLQTLNNSLDVTKTSEIAAIIMEEGVAHLYYISNNQTVLKGKVEISIPKKRSGSTEHDKGKTRFFEKIFNNLLKQINFENIKCVVIASPGFTKDDFKKYMDEQIDDNPKDNAVIKNNINKFLYTHSSSGYKHSLEEILAKPDIKRAIKSTKCINDVEAMEDFNKVLGTDMDKCFFGLKSFEIVYEKNAIDTVIYTDNFLRKLNPQVRKNLGPKIIKLRDSACKVFQFSSQHTTGEKIDQFGGIVGIMTYVVEEVMDITADDLTVENKGEEDNAEIDEGLQEVIDDNTETYNLDNEEDNEGKKEEEIGVAKGGKKKKKDNVNQKIKQQRKKSSINEEND